MSTRIKNVLAMVVALFLLGVSSEAAVCELACGLQIQTAQCHAMQDAMSGSAPIAGMEMDHSHCLHTKKTAPAQAIVHGAGECADGSCSHTSVAAFDKAGPSATSFAAVQWVAVSVVPVDPNLSVSYLGTAKRSLLPGRLVDPLVVSLRV
ncbi:hypothetical protein [Granulicella sp. dw_53]|uniref:hypothetical protein n=1 Tax=Granulicella sp. dw_53 TaxID=2719792 RepID=UPI001BD5C8CC|nr:hypothetical protein [Granulicella sp. dw_53]